MITFANVVSIMKSNEVGRYGAATGWRDKSSRHGPSLARLEYIGAASEEIHGVMDALMKDVFLGFPV